MLHGDELGRTQGGNNNAYCQDTEIAWVDWSLLRKNDSLTSFVAALARLRRDHPVFRRRRFFDGRPIRSGDQLRDIAWFRQDAAEMTEQDWGAGFGRYITVFLNGDAIGDLDRRGERVTDSSFLMCFNAHDVDLQVRLPGESYGREWAVVVDTLSGEAHPTVPEGARTMHADETVTVAGRSLLVLQRTE
jgi:isoamylase